jgi:hypothetical protein
MARAGILPDHEDCVGVGEVLEAYGGFAEADYFAQACAARFVAHVGTIGQIISAELAGEKSIDKCSFVARTP